MERTISNPGQKSEIRTGIKLIAFILLLVFAWLAHRLLLMVFAGVLFSVFLEALTKWVADHIRLSHGWSLAVVLLLLGIVLALLGLRAYPRLAAQASDLSARVPEAVKQVRSSLDNSPVSQLLGSDDKKGSPGLGGSFVTWAGDAVSALFDAAAAGIVVLFVGIYLCAEPRLYYEGAIRLMPADTRQRARQILSRLGSVLQRWIMARILLMAVNGALTALGLWILGVPLALILGVLAGMLNFVPNIGPLIAAVPAILIGWTQGGDKAMYVAGLYLFLQSLDGYVFTPLAQKRAVSLPPAVIIIFQVFMGILAGPLGLLLATPIAATLFTVVDMLYLEERQGEAR